MTFNVQIITFRNLFITILFVLPLVAGTNIDCQGKAFHCFNSTHFMICVDLGGGVSSTIDNFFIPCPPGTVCQGNNHFECELMPSTSTTPLITSTSDATTEIVTNTTTSPLLKEVSTTSSLQLNVTIVTDTNNNENTLLMRKKSDNINANHDDVSTLVTLPDNTTNQRQGEGENIYSTESTTMFNLSLTTETTSTVPHRDKQNYLIAPIDPLATVDSKNTTENSNVIFSDVVFPETLLYNSKNVTSDLSNTDVTSENLINNIVTEVPNEPTKDHSTIHLITPAAEITVSSVSFEPINNSTVLIKDKQDNRSSTHFSTVMDNTVITGIKSSNVNTSPLPAKLVYNSNNMSESVIISQTENIMNTNTAVTPEEQTENYHSTWKSSTIISTTIVPDVTLKTIAQHIPRSKSENKNSSLGLNGLNSTIDNTMISENSTSNANKSQIEIIDGNYSLQSNYNITTDISPKETFMEINTAKSNIDSVTVESIWNINRVNKDESLDSNSMSSKINNIVAIKNYNESVSEPKFTITTYYATKNVNDNETTTFISTEKTSIVSEILESGGASTETSPINNKITKDKDVYGISNNSNANNSIIVINSSPAILDMDVVSITDNLAISSTTEMPTEQTETYYNTVATTIVLSETSVPGTVVEPDQKKTTFIVEKQGNLTDFSNKPSIVNNSITNVNETQLPSTLENNYIIAKTNVPKTISAPMNQNNTSQISKEQMTYHQNAVSTIDLLTETTRSEVTIEPVQETTKFFGLSQDRIMNLSNLSKTEYKSVITESSTAGVKTNQYNNTDYNMNANYTTMTSMTLQNNNLTQTNIPNAQTEPNFGTVAMKDFVINSSFRTIDTTVTTGTNNVDVYETALPSSVFNDISSATIKPINDNLTVLIQDTYRVSQKPIYANLTNKSNTKNSNSNLPNVAEDDKTINRNTLITVSSTNNFITSNVSENINDFAKKNISSSSPKILTDIKDIEFLTNNEANYVLTTAFFETTSSSPKTYETEYFNESEKNPETIITAAETKIFEITTRFNLRAYELSYIEQDQTANNKTVNITISTQDNLMFNSSIDEVVYSNNTNRTIQNFANLPIYHEINTSSNDTMVIQPKVDVSKDNYVNMANLNKTLLEFNPVPKPNIRESNSKITNKSDYSNAVTINNELLGFKINKSYADIGLITTDQSFVKYVRSKDITEAKDKLVTKKFDLSLATLPTKSVLAPTSSVEQQVNINELNSVTDTDQTSHDFKKTTATTETPKYLFNKEEYKVGVIDSTNAFFTPDASTATSAYGGRRKLNNTIYTDFVGPNTTTQELNTISTIEKITVPTHMKNFDNMQQSSPKPEISIYVTNENNKFVNPDQMSALSQILSANTNDINYLRMDGEKITRERVGSLGLDTGTNAYETEMKNQKNKAVDSRNVVNNTGVLQFLRNSSRQTHQVNSDYQEPEDNISVTIIPIRITNSSNLTNTVPSNRTASINFHKYNSKINNVTDITNNKIIIHKLVNLDGNILQIKNENNGTNNQQLSAQQSAGKNIDVVPLQTKKYNIPNVTEIGVILKTTQSYKNKIFSDVVSTTFSPFNNFYNTELVDSKNIDEQAPYLSQIKNANDHDAGKNIRRNKNQILVQTNETLIETFTVSQIHKNNIKTISTSKDKNVITDLKYEFPKTNAKPLISQKIQNTHSIDNYCKGRNRGRYADIEDCSKFYICIGRSQPIIGACPQNTVFSDIKKQCTKNLTHCIINKDFLCVSEGRFSDIRNRNQYFICIKNKKSFVRFTLHCSNSYHLDKNSVKCVHDTEVQNESNSQSSKNSKDSSVTKSSKIEDEKISKNNENTESLDNSKFECVEPGKYADSYNCRRYYICLEIKENVFRRKRKTCDSDEVFHKEKKKCVDSESYECDTL